LLDFSSVLVVQILSGVSGSPVRQVCNLSASDRYQALY